MGEFSEAVLEKPIICFGLLLALIHVLRVVLSVL